MVLPEPRELDRLYGHDFSVLVIPAVLANMVRPFILMALRTFPK
jgi:hypothetical protein